MAYESQAEATDAAPEVASSTQSIGDAAAGSQVGATPLTDAEKSVNNEYMMSQGFPDAQNIFAPDDNDPIQMDAQDNQNSQFEAREPDTAGKERDLSPENRQRLDDLTVAQDNALARPDATNASVMKAMQDQADTYGTNPDGSPKVSILAYQSRDVNPETNYYASFNNSRADQISNQFLLEGARTLGTDYPSSRVGYLGSTVSGRHTGNRV
ncbi:MAG: hypothetical protein IT342_00915 [Candidatus Melainabacteria bacterium]|nr:hypothetical protein [Candidatus Melainabacteria bacterium]